MRQQKIIITEQQAKVLNIYREDGPMSTKQLGRMPGMSRINKSSEPVKELIKLGLLITDKQASTTRPTRPVSVHSITMAGRRALAAHHARQAMMADKATRAQPNNYNILTAPVYTPPKNSYQRNQGHPHIKSHGTLC